MRLQSWAFPIVAATVAAGVALAATPVRAQGVSMMNPGPVVHPPRAAPPPAPPPPGLPGAVGNVGTPPPPPAESGLSPTAALFDAINRGDLAAARRALGDGAQLDAKNMLGMTPLELAVDLNRNNIAFLLLSIAHEAHAAAASAGASPALSVPPAPAAAAKAARGGGSVEALLLAGQPAPGTPVARPARQRAAVSATPPIDGYGGPNPAVGFLGFGPETAAPAQN